MKAQWFYRTFFKKRILKKINILDGKRGYYANRGIMNTGCRSSNTEEYDMKASVCRKEIDKLQRLIA